MASEFHVYIKSDKQPSISSLARTASRGFFVFNDETPCTSGSTQPVGDGNAQSVSVASLEAGTLLGRAGRIGTGPPGRRDLLKVLKNSNRRLTFSAETPRGHATPARRGAPGSGRIRERREELADLLRRLSQSTLVGSLWTLLLAPLVARTARVRGAGRTTQTGLTALDWVLAVGLGIAMALLCTIWLSPFTVPGSRVLGSPDFGEYCWHIGLYVFDAMHEWGVNRAKLAGLPAGLLAPHIGVMDSLLVSAVGSLAVVVGAVYMWGRALHGRTAGVAAAVVLGAVGPLAALGRMVTFYPPVTAGLALASAGAACALRWRTPLTIAMASIGASVALLVDQRGILWALPALGLAALATVIGPHKRWRGFSLRLVALVLPVMMAWNLGQWSYKPNSRSLEGQVAIYDELVSRECP